MNNYFIWKNINSNDVAGLVVRELPPITKPKMRTTKETIDGKDGDIVNELGFEAYDKTIKIGLTKDYNIDDIVEWLNGESNITFSNEPDKYYKSRIIDGIDYEKLLRFKTANIKLHTQPFKYSTISRFKTFNITSETEINIVNSGNYTSKPTITFYGSGTINVSINGVQAFVLDLTSDASITVDCDEQEAFSGNILKNRKMDGKFPILQKGRNVISWTGTLTKIEIQNYSRWL